jgi:hypothetical protein
MLDRIRHRLAHGELYLVADIGRKAVGPACDICEAAYFGKTGKIRLYGHFLPTEALPLRISGRGWPNASVSTDRVHLESLSADRVPALSTFYA